MFYAVFMLKSINDIEDKERDGYATINGIIQRGTSLIAPLLGAALFYVSERLGFHDLLFPTFLTFSICVLAAIPLIRRMPNAALPCSIALPLKAVVDRRHGLAIAAFLTTISCECLMSPLLMISSFALFGKVFETGWFTSMISAIAIISLALTHYVRVPERRWMMLGGSLIGVGLGFLAFNLSFTFSALLFAGAVYAILRVNYQAVWYAFSTRLMEREWGHFGKNQALVLGEIFIFAARIGVAGVLLICGGLNLSFTQSLTVLTIFYLLSASANIFIARLQEERQSEKAVCSLVVSLN